MDKCSSTHAHALFQQHESTDLYMKNMNQSVLQFFQINSSWWHSIELSREELKENAVLENMWFLWRFRL